MTQTDFLAAVERDLQLRHVPFDMADLAEFLESVWPLVEPGDTPERWAEAFHKSGPTPAPGLSPEALPPPIGA